MICAAALPRYQVIMCWSLCSPARYRMGAGVYVGYRYQATLKRWVV
ncbi:hypothetical protein ACLBR5_07435 [Escherichia coli]